MLSGAAPIVQCRMPRIARICGAKPPGFAREDRVFRHQVCAKTSMDRVLFPIRVKTKTQPHALKTLKSLIV